MCYHVGMKTTRIEPGLLPTFRGFMLLELGVTLAGGIIQERGEPVHSPAVVAILGLASAGLLGYLSWPRLQRRLGSAYLPVAIMVAAALPIIEQYLFLQNHPIPDLDSLLANDWQAVLFLSFPLLIVSWQYSFHSVIGFCLGTGLFDLISIALAHARLDAFAQQDYFRTLAVRTAFFLLLGHTLSHLKTQRALERANRQLQHYATALEQLTISRERNRVARELHDTVAHTLSGLAVQLEAVKALWTIDAPKAQSMLDRSLEDTRTGLTETRRAIKALRANPLEELGLTAAVGNLAAAAADRAGFTLELCLPPRLGDLSPDVEQCFYRVTQEALENVVKHSEAQHVSIQLTHDAERLVLTVADDGCGFMLAGVDPGRQFGIQGLRERTRLIGGHLDITSQPGQGTKVQLSVEQRR